MPNFLKELEVAKLVAQEVGKIQLKHFRTGLKVIRKTSKEFVSNVDMECQCLSQKILQENFSYPVLSEEKRCIEKNDGALFWIVDPLDGTHNFIAGVPHFGVSIALASKTEFMVGVIYLPYFNEMYYAVKGIDEAYMNGIRITTSKNNDLEKSMVTYDNQFYLNKDSLKRYQQIIEHCFTTRIFGSAIYDFSLVASGRTDARIWNNTKIFDFAAGIVIVRGAGGEVTDFLGNEINLKSKEVIASNGNIHKQLLNILNR